MEKLLLILSLKRRAKKLPNLLVLTAGNRHQQPLTDYPNEC